MEFSGALQLLETDGVQGAQLLMDRLDLYHRDDLKRWLKCRALKLDGNRTELIQRIERRVSTGRSHILDPGLDDGMWLEKKRRQVLTALGFNIPEAPLVPIAGWEVFPGYDIPKSFNEGHVFHYIVESSSISTLPTVLPDDEETDETDEADKAEAETEAEGSEPAEGTRQTMARGRQYVRSNFILDVRDKQVGNFYFIKAEVRASMKLEKRNVTATLSVESGSIVDASCTCIQRTLRRCSHVAAVLLFICKHVEEKGYSALAGTSKPREWGKGKVTRNPGKGLDKEYNKRKFAPRAAWDPRPSHMQNNEPFTPKELEDFNKTVQLSLRNTGEDCPFVKHIPLQYSDFDVTEEVMRYMHLDNLAQIFYEEFDDNFNTGYFIPPPDSDEQPRCESFLFKGTQAQSDSDTWKRLRSVMITASTAKSILSLKSPEAKKNFLRRHLWHYNQVTTKAMQYGIDNEEKARKCYTRIVRAVDKKTTVEQTGLWGKPTAAYLGCSPDGIVTSGNGQKWLLEIKCLWILRDKKPKLFEKVLTKEQLSRFPVRRLPNKDLELKKNHSHYYQVQMAMDVLDLEECDYFIWSPKGHLLVPVVRDRIFWEPKEKMLADIHCTLIIPEYFLQRTPRNLHPIQFTRDDDDD